MLLFTISALRAVIEMLGLCLVGQGVLAVISGKKRTGNPIYQLFCLITGFPRHLVAAFLPAQTSTAKISMLTALMLFVMWIILAIFRKSV